MQYIAHLPSLSRSPRRPEDYIILLRILALAYSPLCTLDDYHTIITRVCHGSRCRDNLERKLGRYLSSILTL